MIFSFFCDPKRVLEQSISSDEESPDTVSLDTVQTTDEAGTSCINSNKENDGRSGPADTGLGIANVSDTGSELQLDKDDDLRVRSEEDSGSRDEVSSPVTDTEESGNIPDLTMGGAPTHETDGPEIERIAEEDKRPLVSLDAHNESRLETAGEGICVYTIRPVVAVNHDRKEMRETGPTLLLLPDVLDPALGLSVVPTDEQMDDKGDGAGAEAASSTHQADRADKNDVLLSGKALVDMIGSTSSTEESIDVAVGAVDSYLDSSSSGNDEKSGEAVASEAVEDVNLAVLVCVEMRSSDSEESGNEKDDGAFPFAESFDVFAQRLEATTATSVDSDDCQSEQDAEDAVVTNTRLTTAETIGMQQVVRDETEGIEPDDVQDLSSASEKSVHFADPLVTSSWDVPRINAEELEELFYTAMEISRFRQQRKGSFPARQYDKDKCLRLVQDLDTLGAESFVKGDYQKALEAFNHSLQVKTQIMTDCDNFSTSTTIHCIADVYGKKGKWIQAMDAYNAAMDVLLKADESEETLRSKVSLEQKLHTIQRLLGIHGRSSERDALFF